MSIYICVWIYSYKGLDINVYIYTLLHLNYYMDNSILLINICIYLYALCTCKGMLLLYIMVFNEMELEEH